MLFFSEISLFNGLKGKQTIEQDFKQRDPNLIDINNLKLCFFNELREHYETFFCSLCNQIVIDKPRSCHVFSKDHFAKKLDSKEKIFISLNHFIMSLLLKNIKNYFEITRDYNESTKFF